jgi:hypothetical protein
MPRRERPRGRTRRYIGAIWEDGRHSCVAIAASEDQPDRRRLVDFRLCNAEDLDATIAHFEQLVAPENGEIHWMFALRGASCMAEACLVPREVENAPDETKAIACLAGTAWGDPETAAQMQLALAYQIDGAACTIAAAPSATLSDLAERFRGNSVRFTCDAIALAELVRSGYPEFTRRNDTAVLAVNCSETAASFVILQASAPQIARQSDLGATIRSHSARRRAAQSGPATFEPGTTSWTSDEYVPSWKAGSPAVDAPTWTSAFLGELRDTLSLYNEYGGHISDIGLVLVTGEAAERFELRASLPKALGFDIEVRELEASKVVVSNEVDVARRVAESEATIAGALALLATGRRTDVLTFAVDPHETTGFDLPLVDSIGRRAIARRVLVTIGVLILGLVAGVGYVLARYHETTLERDEARQQLELEERRAAELHVIAKEKAANEARFAHVAALLASIDAIRLRQRTPARLLADLQQLLPERAGLERVAFDGSWVTISGASEAASDADTFALSLQAASDRFADVSPATSADTYTRVPALESGLGPEVRPLERFSIRARVVTPASAHARRH